MPICDHRNIKGHAVRAAYLLSGATDVAGETQDPALLKMINRVWRNTTSRNMYITGGIGPSASNEGFTHDYDLPNLHGLPGDLRLGCPGPVEPSAGPALRRRPLRRRLRAFALQRRAGRRLARRQTVLLRQPAGEPRDTITARPGSAAPAARPTWRRTLASLGGYAYAVSDDALWVNLYIQGSANATVAGRKVTLNVATEYPWDGKVVLKPQVDQTTKFELRLRVPGWCQGATRCGQR